MPGMENGKPAGVRCPHLDAQLRCQLWGLPERPQVCGDLRPAPDICGANQTEALRLLGDLERATAPDCAD
jgi:hypothetical protein